MEVEDNSEWTVYSPPEVDHQAEKETIRDKEEPVGQRTGGTVSGVEKGAYRGENCKHPGNSVRGTSALLLEEEDAGGGEGAENGEAPHLEPGAAPPAQSESSGDRCGLSCDQLPLPPTVWIRSKMGRYIAMMIPPTTAPSTTMRMGSSVDVSPATAVSTSSS